MCSIYGLKTRWIHSAVNIKYMSKHLIAPNTFAGKYSYRVEISCDRQCSKKLVGAGCFLLCLKRRLHSKWMLLFSSMHFCWINRWGKRGGELVINKSKGCVEKMKMNENIAWIKLKNKKDMSSLATSVSWKRTVTKAHWNPIHRERDTENGTKMPLQDFTTGFSTEECFEMKYFRSPRFFFCDAWVRKLNEMISWFRA